MDSWSFTDTNGWTSDLNYAPVSFTNITSMTFGDGTSLVVDSNLPAWLQYNVFETNGITNLTVDIGSVTLWLSPNWAGTNDATGGSGPQDWGRLIEVGGYTADSSLGWWSLYLDPAGANLYFSAQTNDSSGNLYAMSAPVDLTTNYWHFIALTYSSTNVSLYLDGQLLTNDVGGLSVWPGPDVLANGFFIGSDSNGVDQTHGEFDDIRTYNVVLNSNQVQHAFLMSEGNYIFNPFNWHFMQAAIVSAPSTPSGSPTNYEAITGQGSLQLVGSVTAITSSNVWITNVTAWVTNNGTMAMVFTIQGGSNGVPYDVFAIGALTNSTLSSGTNGWPWAWVGQGNHGNTYTFANISNSACYLILGTPKDTDGDGLTDAYELLVSKTSITNNDTDGSGISDAWDVLLGLNPLVNQLAQPGTRSNYSYTTADWLSAVSGVRTGSITNDPEGNVMQVSQ